MHYKYRILLFRRLHLKHPKVNWTYANISAMKVAFESKATKSKKDIYLR